MSTVCLFILITFSHSFIPSVLGSRSLNKTIFTSPLSSQAMAQMVKRLASRCVPLCNVFIWSRVQSSVASNFFFLNFHVQIWKNILMFTVTLDKLFFFYLLNTFGEFADQFLGLLQMWIFNGLFPFLIFSKFLHFSISTEQTTGARFHTRATYNCSFNVCKKRYFLFKITSYLSSYSVHVWIFLYQVFFNHVRF